MKDPSLFTHRLRISNGCGKETIPLYSSIQTSPIIVPVASVRQAPWYEGILLFISGITFTLSISTTADSSQSSCARLALFDILVAINKFPAFCPVTQSHNLIWQISPIRTRCSRDQLEPGFN